MHAGLVVEEGNVHDILKSPLHPYTRALLDARPSLRKAVLGDQLAAFTSNIPANPSAMMGCPLADVCKQAVDICRLEPPPMVLVDQDHSVRCLLFVRPHD
jgi:oligopeptide/dipeptide ABC transporter ATP-binding protein